MSGRFVYECDGIDEDLMTKFEREANQVKWIVRWCGGGWGLRRMKICK